MEVPVDTPTPLFVANNPEFCHSLDNERSDLSIRLSNRPDLNVTRVVPVQFEPKISTQLEIGNLAQGYNAMEEFRFPEYAPAYWVEIDTGRFYEASGGGTKEGEVPLAAYNHLGLRQNVPEVIYPNQKPFKVYRLCIGAGTWSMLKYFIDNGIQFKLTHLRHESAPTHTVNYPILPFIHSISPQVLIDPSYDLNHAIDYSSADLNEVIGQSRMVNPEECRLKNEYELLKNGEQISLRQFSTRVNKLR